VCELALALNLTIGELHHGRGTPMSLHELCVVWPAYFKQKAEDDRLVALAAE
jgi:hypothetical protein